MAGRRPHGGPLVRQLPCSDACKLSSKVRKLRIIALAPTDSRFTGLASNVFTQFLGPAFSATATMSESTWVCGAITKVVGLVTVSEAFGTNTDLEREHIRIWPNQVKHLVPST